MFVDGANTRYLPYSGRRYIVTVQGEVFDHLGNDLVKTNSKDGIKIELSWINGLCDYYIGTLVIVTFHPMHLPDHLWINIEPLHFDENPCNNETSNLTYRFDCGLLEHEQLPGYYYVPHYTAYVINREGVLRHHETLREKTWFSVKPDHLRNSKGGYYFTRITNVPKVNGVVYRHRALCLTFKPILNAKTINMVVNHIDGVPGNDDLDNLEWVSYAKNNQHAHDNKLTGNKNKPVLVKNLKTGEIISYRNTKEAAVKLGYSTSNPIRYRIRFAQNVLYDDYLQFKFDDGDSWPKVNMKATPVRFRIGSKMAARNVFTGEVITFDTFDQGAELTGIDKQTIMIHVRDRQYLPFNGYNFSYYTEGMEWPEHPERNLRAYKLYPVRTPDPILVYDEHLNKEMFFESRNELAKHFDISPSYATYLAVESLTYKERYRIRYYFIRENIKVPLSWNAEQQILLIAGNP